jgi:lactoylglutathione lyase
MKRFHVHVHVEDLQASIAFYSRLFAAPPSRVENDYAKWMLDDPRINFAVSNRGGKPGVDHLGLQTDSEEELEELKARAQAADMTLMDQGQTTCCYARSDKYWLVDPGGIAWEQFRTLATIPVFSEAPALLGGQAGHGSGPDATAVAGADPAPAACCTPKPRGNPIAIPVKSSDTCC